MSNTSISEIDKFLGLAQEAFHVLKNKNISERAEFMQAVADEIERLDDDLIQTAQDETKLPAARLIGEKARTVFQWRSYADALLSGNVLQVRIDTAVPERNPPKPDLRKTYAPIGPIVVFCASNFPFAFSTAGGDTASAIAAGCPVIVNAHSAHPKTSGIMANAIQKAINKTCFPQGVFSHVYSNSYENGTYLVSHPIVKAIGFTGSHTGGKALYDLANKRPEPIPVFAEMGSVNPVFVLPEKMKRSAEELAKQYVGSLTLGVGQFCTNPGILIIPANEDAQLFIQTLIDEIERVQPAPMLHRRIAEAYHKNKAKLIQERGVVVFAEAKATVPEYGNAAVATVPADIFVENEKLAEEVFGPFGLVVTYEGAEQATAVAKVLKGQLTTSLLADKEDINNYIGLINVLKDKCGRLLFNNFPTGVEVAYAMQHGGPYPAATDSRFTSVGPDAIKRFTRPLSYQNWPDEFLPDELKNNNPLRIWRTLNGDLTKDSIR